MVVCVPVVEGAFAVSVALVLGTAIGAEREWRRHPGGLRSCAVVAAAACVFARVAVIHGGDNPGAALGAVASGVGFLGAGAILRHGAIVRGLSTAATFWAVAAVGLAAGVQEFSLSVSLTAAVLLTHMVLRPLSTWIDRLAPPADEEPR